ncbi:dynactin subunit 2-like [Ornithodoros turicata]|uniref:dynactin subunit 2-like n=1 Tax=Ornithodoros turicata TaxID=34597 RepID=UPI0031389CF2
MADSKYAGLPGIAHDQPDVYETDELPEAEQVISDVYVDQSDSVEKLSLSATDAYNRFKGCIVDNSASDFTEGISRTHARGYDVISGEWEMAGDKEKESPEQKWRRLQCEVKELITDVDAIKESIQEGDKQGSGIAPGQLLQSVAQMQKMLLDLNLEHTLGPDALFCLSDPQAALRKKMFAQLEMLKAGSSSKGDSPAVPPTRGHPTVPAGGFAYELYYRPEYSKLQETAKLAMLEDRIKKLENIVGFDSQKLAMLTGPTNGKSLIEVANHLSSKLFLLEAPNIEQVEARLLVLQQRLQQLSEKRVLQEDADRQSKVNELYELLRKADTLSDSLPRVVERLVCLQDIHEQALHFSKALNQLDLVQQHLSLGLKNNDKSLSDVQKNFVQNIETINKNISLLESKLSQLKK